MQVASGNVFELNHVLAKVEGDKDRNDLRDRMAYIYLTGAFPTHLRRRFTSLLRMATEYAGLRSRGGSRFGGFAVNQDVVERLQLDDHPFVVLVRKKMEEGYRVHTPSIGTQERRPYTRLSMYRKSGGKDDYIVVQTDGSIKEGWD